MLGLPLTRLSLDCRLPSCGQRASFVTWIKSEHHDDETLQSAAAALRHSSAMQSSHHYDKGQQAFSIQYLVSGIWYLVYVLCLIKN